MNAIQAIKFYTPTYIKQVLSEVIEKEHCKERGLSYIRLYSDRSYSLHKPEEVVFDSKHVSIELIELMLSLYSLVESLTVEKVTSIVDNANGYPYWYNDLYYKICDGKFFSYNGVEEKEVVGGIMIDKLHHVGKFTRALIIYNNISSINHNKLELVVEK